MPSAVEIVEQHIAGLIAAGDEDIARRMYGDMLVDAHKAASSRTERNQR